MASIGTTSNNQAMLSACGSQWPGKVTTHSPQDQFPQDRAANTKAMLRCVNNHGEERIESDVHGKKQGGLNEAAHGTELVPSSQQDDLLCNASEMEAEACARQAGVCDTQSEYATETERHSVPDTDVMDENSRRALMHLKQQRRGNKRCLKSADTHRRTSVTNTSRRQPFNKPAHPVKPEKDRVVKTEEIALFMRCKKRYLHSNFKPIPPTPGGWEDIVPDRIVAWDQTTEKIYDIVSRVRTQSESTGQPPWKSTFSELEDPMSSDLTTTESSSCVSEKAHSAELQDETHEQGDQPVHLDDNPTSRLPPAVEHDMPPHRLRHQSLNEMPSQTTAYAQGHLRRYSHQSGLNFLAKGFSNSKTGLLPSGRSGEPLFLNAEQTLWEHWPDEQKHHPQARHYENVFPIGSTNETSTRKPATHPLALNTQVFAGTQPAFHPPPHWNAPPPPIYANNGTSAAWGKHTPGVPQPGSGWGNRPHSMDLSFGMWNDAHSDFHPRKGFPDEQHLSNPSGTEPRRWSATALELGWEDRFASILKVVDEEAQPQNGQGHPNRRSSYTDTYSQAFSSTRSSVENGMALLVANSQLLQNVIQTGNMGCRYCGSVSHCVAKDCPYIPTLSPHDAWSRMLQTAHGNDIHAFMEALEIYSKVRPADTLPMIAKQLYDTHCTLCLVALDQPVQTTTVLVDLQGRARRRYTVVATTATEFSDSQVARQMSSIWGTVGRRPGFPATLEQNLARLADAGFPRDVTEIATCRSCKVVGHWAKDCTASGMKTTGHTAAKDMPSLNRKPGQPNDTQACMTAHPSNPVDVSSRRYHNPHDFVLVGGT